MNTIYKVKVISSSTPTKSVSIFDDTIYLSNDEELCDLFEEVSLDSCEIEKEIIN